MPDADRQLWPKMLAHLRARHPVLCRHWFEDLADEGVSAGAIHLRASNDVQRDYLRRDCADAFTEAAQHSMGALIGVRFLGPADQGPAPAPPGAPRVTVGNHSSSARISPADNDDQLPLTPDYAFENFVIGPENRFAHAAAIAVAANPGLAYNPYFVHGDVGLGKTHLLQAICLSLRQNRPDLRLYYTSCEGFVSQYVNAVEQGAMNSFRHRFRDVDILAIDDVHFLARGERSQEEFFHTFNALFQARKQIILSSDAPPHEIPDLQQRLISRFKWGLVAEVVPPTFETRVAILKKKAHVRGLNLPNEIATYIAERIDRNIRELEGAIKQIHVLAGINGGVPDLDTVRGQLGLEEPRTGNAVRIDRIIDAVCAHFGVKGTDVLGKRRHRSVALPRHVCMYLARQLTPHSLEEIGLKFGGRDHTVVMYAVRNIESKMGIDPNFADTVSDLRSLLQT